MQWISVEERLPEPEKLILITDGVQVFAGRRLDVPVKGKEIYDYWRGMPYSEETDNITHWMPLPELPK